MSEEKLFGVYKGFFYFSQVEIIIGKQNGKLHGQISYLDIGLMNDNLVDVEIDGDRISFKIDLNGEHLPIELSIIENKFVGMAQIMDKTIEVEWMKISEEVEFKELHYIIPPKNIECLKKNNSYRKEPVNKQQKYERNNKKVLEKAKKLGIEVENNQDFATAIEIIKNDCSILS